MLPLSILFYKKRLRKPLNYSLRTRATLYARHRYLENDVCARRLTWRLFLRFSFPGCGFGSWLLFARRRMSLQVPYTKKKLFSYRVLAAEQKRFAN